MRFINFAGEFDSNGQASVAMPLPEGLDGSDTTVFVAVESLGLETLIVDGMGGSEYDSRVPIFKAAFGRVAHGARAITVTVFGKTGSAFHGLIAAVRAKAFKEWQELTDDPSCYGCVKVGVWAFKAGLAAVGIPTLGDAVGDMAAIVAGQLAQQLSSGPVAHFCQQWFGPSFTNWVADRAIGDWLNKIIGIAGTLHTLAEAMCIDLGPCDVR